MRQLVYYVASTLDGFIAEPDGSFGCFPSEGEHLADLFQLFPETIPGPMREDCGVAGVPNERFDTVVMGRRTYEVGLNAGIPNPYTTLRQLVFSGTLEDNEHVELVRSNPVECVRQLKSESGKDIWLCGGGELAGQIFEEIDELILKLNPVVIGDGVPLFGRRRCSGANLKLKERKDYASGFSLLSFELGHAKTVSAR